MNDILQSILQAILGSPEAMAVIVTFILSVVPGPFKGIIESLIKWLVEKFLATKQAKTEAKADTVATLAVRHAEDIKQQLIRQEVPKPEASAAALDEAIKVAREYGLFENDPNGEARLRAKYQELKGQELVPVIELPSTPSN